MRRKSPMWYLGFLSLLSLLYFREGGTGFLGFLGFLPYFSIYSMTDERVERNIDRGARNGFLFSIFFGSASVATLYLTGAADMLIVAFTVLFGGTLIVGILSIVYYDVTGRE